MKTKQILLMALVSLFAVVAFGSCSEDENEGGTTSAFDGRLSGKLPGISTSGYSFELEDYRPAKTFPIGADGSFDFVLPTPTAADLEGFSLEDGLSITPSDARGFEVDYLEVVKNGDGAGYATREKETSTSHTMLVHIYVDKDVVVNGSSSETEGEYKMTTTSNMALKAGWNYVVLKEEASETSATFSATTGNIPDLPWVFETYSSYSTSATKPQSKIFKTIFRQTNPNQ
jgi:hypothetical protein